MLDRSMGRTFLCYNNMSQSELTTRGPLKPKASALPMTFVDPSLNQFGHQMVWFSNAIWKSGSPTIHKYKIQIKNSTSLDCSVKQFYVKNK